MSSLIVLLPSSDALAPRGWEATPMPFVLLDRKGAALRAGSALLDALPKADVTVLVVAARDTLLLNAKLPPVTGPRLRRVLPNVVEEHLIQDAQHCHIAIDPLPLATGERCVAVIDRDWFSSVIDRFCENGHRRLRAVPLIHCIPLPEVSRPQQAPDSLTQLHDVSGPASARTSGRTGDTTQIDVERKVTAEGGTSVDGGENIPGGASTEATADAMSALIVRRNKIGGTSADPWVDDAEWVELALRQGALGFGMSVNAAQLDATIAELAQRQTLMVYSLVMESGTQPDSEPNTGAGGGFRFGSHSEPQAGADVRASEPWHPGTAFPLAARALPWTIVAREALACRFDLCQFEFANAGRGRTGAGGLKPWRVSLGFVAAALAVSIVAINVQWFQLRHRRDALNGQMTQLVKTAFPGTTVVLDPHAQMAAELARMRGAVGELRADDFLALAAGVAHALGPVPSSSIAGLNYSGGALDMTFKPGTDIDKDALTRRFTAQGLSAQEDNGKWTVRPTQSKPR
ncbi:hypothetical protein EOS_17870 [Caballeronia mineralivorans PML1(12)]|uniref:General secretion pathway protein GspL n=1 Tax=Caballeronia mineralivorans PML1(12) TaxID=908627 RepID=A0A0J1CWW0_9BURK|nr:type II secretion system protein GspL [Caballeronia mineralivorans]KLU24866.1 hypothetical protein EOS_17870 [Caballeronia mineralivorans PML1(12)]